jgi:hypothetical protein
MNQRFFHANGAAEEIAYITTNEMGAVFGRPSRVSIASRFFRDHDSNALTTPEIKLTEKSASPLGEGDDEASATVGVAPAGARDAAEARESWSPGSSSSSVLRRTVT